MAAAGSAASAWLRPPAVAGSFYPATEAGVRAELAAFARALQATTPGQRPVQSKGAVCPHAGWRFAGALAYRTLARCVLPACVVILGVNHRYRQPPPWSVWPMGAWQTPLGDVPVDAELAAALMAAAPELTASDLAHRQDHATEVLLPMLQALRKGQPGGLRIVPIVPFLHPSHERSAVETGAKIGRVLARWPEPVFVLASNDMTHFAPADVAREQDAKAIARIEALDAAGLLTTARAERITMCGAQPVAATLAATAELGARRADLVGYTHSGVITGDLNDVVAYAGMVIE